MLLNEKDNNSQLIKQPKFNITVLTKCIKVTNKTTKLEDTNSLINSIREIKKNINLKEKLIL